MRDCFTAMRKLTFLRDAGTYFTLEALYVHIHFHITSQNLLFWRRLLGDEYDARGPLAGALANDAVCLHVGNGVIDDLLTYGACAGWSMAERKRTRLKINGDLEEVSRTRDLGVGGERCVVSGHQIKGPGAALWR
jgi:hypothetical protein